MFVGCYIITSNANIKNEYGEYYPLELSDKFKNFEGRLVVKFKKLRGPKQAKLNISDLGNFEVYQILSEKYSGEKFLGYKNIDLDFESMKHIINNGKTDWYNNLSTIKGIYLITDKNNKLYVGSAYGKEGVWGRWREYVLTNGHGNNQALRTIVLKDPDYATNNFRFSLIEYYKEDITDEDLFEREKYWKSILRSRDLGYNKN